MTASSIRAARAALHAALAAEFNDPAVQVLFGPPSAYEAAQVVSMLGLSGPASEEPAALGNQRREERYRIEVAVKFHDGAGTAASVDAAAWELVDRVRDAVHADVTLAGTVRMSGVVQTESPGPLPAEGGGWFEIVTVQVECQQRVTAERA